MAIIILWLVYDLRHFGPKSPWNGYDRRVALLITPCQATMFWRPACLNGRPP